MMGKRRIVNPIKVGDVFTSNQGYKMTVVDDRVVEALNNFDIKRRLAIKEGE